MPGVKTRNINVRCTKAEKERRIEEASIWLVEHPDSGYMDFCNVFTVKWDLSRDVVNGYRKNAMKRVGQTSSEDIDTAKRLAQASLSQMLRKAMEKEDFKLAFEIRKEMNKVTGAHAPVRTEVATKEDRKIFNVTPEEVELKKVD